MQDLFISHHEMGHIEYYMLYADQPTVFQQSSNDGFHEAIGDLIGLSVMTPQYWKQIGLIQELPTGHAVQINQLFRMALEKIPVFQFIYALENWRYAVFRGQVETKDLNCEYWDYMLKILGVRPPISRSEDDFDAAAKFHISSDGEYGR